jgi:hypothetical protein
MFVGAVTCLDSSEAAASPFRIETTERAEVASYASTERLASGALFDQESGPLAGVSLTAALSWRRWQLELAASVLLGTIGYVGQSLIGLPLPSQTRLRHFQLAARPTYRIGSTPFFIGASLESRTIDRRIEPTPIAQGLHETLNQGQVGPLGGAQWETSFGLSIELRVTVVWTFDSTLDVDFAGAYDNARLTLPRSDAESLAIELRYPLAPRLAATAEAKGETFRPARSASEPLTKDGVSEGSFAYPGSIQDQWSVGLGVRASF